MPSIKLSKNENGNKRSICNIEKNARLKKVVGLIGTIENGMNLMRIGGMI
jgi:hypothetical protein